MKIVLVNLCRNSNMLELSQPYMQLCIQCILHMYVRGSCLDLGLTRLPPRDSTLDGRCTRKPFSLSRVHPICLVYKQDISISL